MKAGAHMAKAAEERLVSIRTAALRSARPRPASQEYSRALATPAKRRLEAPTPRLAAVQASTFSAFLRSSQGLLDAEPFRPGMQGTLYPLKQR